MTRDKRIKMTEIRATNLTWHEHQISKKEREHLMGHRGVVLWLTGLPSSGKSTIANLVDAKLHARGVHAFVLDGDNIRHGLNKNLGFSPEDREENIRRIGEVAKLFAEGGLIAITAFISPYRKDRDAARALLPQGEFIEAHVSAPVDVCEKRDPKGMYQKAKAGVVKEFTGVSAPYEAPLSPEIVLDSSSKGPDVLADEVLAYFEDEGIIRRSR
jgi:adenylylsulfate kinase